MKNFRETNIVGTVDGDEGPFAISVTVVRKGLTEKVIFEQRPKEVREAPWLFV